MKNKYIKLTIIISVALILTIGFVTRANGSYLDFLSIRKLINQKFLSDDDNLNLKYEDIELIGGYEFAKDGFRVLESDDEYLYGVIDSNNLYRTKGINEKRELIQTFDKNIITMHTLENKNLLLSTSESRWIDRPNGDIYLFDDDSKELKKVLTLKSGDAYHWNIASDKKGNVYISEYGIKSEKDNARRIYKSDNFGEDFKLIYNPKKEEGYHNHKIIVDKNNENIVYQVIGDLNKRLLISEDKGDNWRSIDWGNYHPTSIIDIGDYLILGLDGAPYSGIARFNKETEKVEEVFKTPKPYGGSIYSMIEHEGKIYAGNMSYSNKEKWHGSIMVSKDKGKTWEIEYIFDKLSEDMGVGLNKLVSHEDKLFVLCQIPYKCPTSGENKHYFGTIELE